MVLTELNPILTLDDRKSPQSIVAMGPTEKERVMESGTECLKLAARFERMAADEGLRDVKFFVRNADEAAAESVCEEVNRLYAAVDRGEEADLDFRDSCRA